MHVRAGINVDFDDTSPENAGSYQDTQIHAGIQFPVYKNKWFLDISGYVILRDFRFNPQFSLSGDRKDTEEDLYVMLCGPFAEHLQILFIVQQTWNDSNITQASNGAAFDPFNFDRTVVSCLLAFEY